ncbi:MAG TPA: hypothetical protein DD636_03775, partial [Anaerolineaceae bacterium]|nr:hypothetical protein [Anaerolineaceae bacterium]
MKIFLQQNSPGLGPMLFVWIGLALLVGALVGYLIFSTIRKNKEEKLKQTSNDILAEAREKARQAELDAKDQALKIIRDAENEIKNRRIELNKEDDRLVKRR